MSASSKSRISKSKSKSKQQTRRRNNNKTVVVPIIACVSGIEVKRAASHYLRPGDSILEFGTMLSHVSQHFLQTIGPTGHAVLVNIKHNNNNNSVVPKSGRNNNNKGHRHRRNPTPFLGHKHERESSSSSFMEEETSHNNKEHHHNNDDDADNDSFKTSKQQESFVDQVDYLELDQFDDWRKLLYRKTVAETCEKKAAAAAPPVAQQQQQRQHYDVVFVNVGAMIGNDLHLTALSMAIEFLKQTASVSSSFQPRVMIINSRSLSSLARRLYHGQQILDGTITLPTPPPRSAMLPARSPEPYIIATVGVQEYRSTIPFVIQSGDAVLEVGCHSGITTSLLHQHASAAAASTAMASVELPSENANGSSSTSTSAAQIINTKQQQQNNKHDVVLPPGFCIGVDIGPRIIQSAKKQYPNIPFAVGDAWKTLQLLQLKHTLVPSSSSSSSCSQLLGYDAVYADIGGLSGPDGLLESISLLEALGYGLEPRCIVIKSLCMKRLASQLKSFTNVWEKIRNREQEEQEEVLIVE